eukprot:4325541-Amphidinium_carterae.1
MLDCQTRIGTRRETWRPSPGNEREPPAPGRSGAIRPKRRLRSFVEDLSRLRKPVLRRVYIAIGPMKKSICTGVLLVAPVMFAGTT